MLSSPRCLLIFEAAARLGSCSAAAREFNLTQPSVSRNIAELEEPLATSLFVRSPTGLELTADGEKLYRTLSESLHRIDDRCARSASARAQAGGRAVAVDRVRDALVRSAHAGVPRRRFPMSICASN